MNTIPKKVIEKGFSFLKMWFIMSMCIKMSSMFLPRLVIWFPLSSISFWKGEIVFWSFKNWHGEALKIVFTTFNSLDVLDVGNNAVETGFTFSICTTTQQTHHSVSALQISEHQLLPFNSNTLFLNCLYFLICVCPF